MDYEKETNRQISNLDVPHCNSCICRSFDIGRKYTDKSGDTWVRTGLHTVTRLSDGNIGGWFYGKGLTEVR